MSAGDVPDLEQALAQFQQDLSALRAKQDLSFAEMERRLKRLGLQDVNGSDTTFHKLLLPPLRNPPRQATLRGFLLAVGVDTPQELARWAGRRLDLAQRGALSRRAQVDDVGGVQALVSPKTETETETETEEPTGAARDVADDATQAVARDSGDGGSSDAVLNIGAQTAMHDQLELSADPEDPPKETPAASTGSPDAGVAVPGRRLLGRHPVVSIGVGLAVPGDSSPPARLAAVGRHHW